MPAKTASLYNLPPQPTSFIGREPEILEIADHLRDRHCRLLTLVGMGGMGKTRLAIESVCRLSTDDFKHGVYYVPLAPLSSSDNIVTTVIDVLGMMIGEDGTPQDELIDFLSGRNLLLVMDNFEHVLDGADLIADILNHTSDVTILTTSREVLNLQMEWVWQVKGMSFPDTDTNDIELYSALKLFINRAKQTRRDFSVEHELEKIIRICQLVEGMPLAIELAASWLKTLSCEGVLKQIEQGIDFLSSRMRDIPERHRSVRAVFDHSWNLLTDDEQAVFSRLSVFRGGFTLDAARAVADADLMTLSGLVEKSMIKRDSHGRYDIHELLRQYAEDHLHGCGEFAATNKQHMVYYAQFMLNREQDVKGKRQIDSLHEIEADFENVRVAWNYAVRHRDEQALSSMMETLALFCDIRSKYQMGEALFNHAVQNFQTYDRVNTPFLNRLRVRYLQVWMLQHRFPVPEHIYQLAKTCQQIAEQQDDRLTTMTCCWIQGILSGFSGELETAKTNLERAIELSQQYDTYYYGRTLRILDNLYTYQFYEDTPYADDVNRKHEIVTRQIQDIHGLADALALKQSRLVRQGKYKESQEYLRDAVSKWRMIGDTKSIGIGTFSLGIHSFFDGEFESATHLLNEGLQMTSANNFVTNHPMIFSFLSMIHCIQGHHNLGFRTIQQIPDITAGTNTKTGKYFVNTAKLVYSICITDHKSARNYLLESFADTQDVALMLTTSLALGSFLLWVDGEYTQAVENFGLVWNHPASRTNWMTKWDLLVQLQSALKTELGEKAYQTAWNHGQSLDLVQTVAILKTGLAEIPSDHVHRANQALLEPLTSRELEILMLIHDGLSNRQIAEQLVVVEDTVKKHITHLYSKLNVKRRTQAISRARELNLL